MEFWQKVVTDTFFIVKIAKLRLNGKDFFLKGAWICLEAPQSYLTQILRKKNSKWVTDVHFLESLGVLTPTSILIFIAAFHCGLQKLIYIDLMQVL